MTFTLSDTDALIGALCIECGQPFRVVGVSVTGRLGAIGANVAVLALLCLIGEAVGGSLHRRHQRIRR